MTEQATHPASKITAQIGGSGGPTYDCRGAVIHSNEKGTVFSFGLEGFPHGPNGYWGRARAHRRCGGAGGRLVGHGTPATALCEQGWPAKRYG